jgi:hypothetical protein
MPSFQCSFTWLQKGPRRLSEALWDRTVISLMRTLSSWPVTTKYTSSGMVEWYKW